MDLEIMFCVAVERVGATTVPYANGSTRMVSSIGAVQVIFVLHLTGRNGRTRCRRARSSPTLRAIAAQNRVRLGVSITVRPARMGRALHFVLSSAGRNGTCNHSVLSSAGRSTGDSHVVLSCQMQDQLARAAISPCQVQDQTVVVAWQCETMRQGTHFARSSARLQGRPVCHAFLSCARARA